MDNVHNYTAPVSISEAMEDLGDFQVEKQHLVAVPNTFLEALERGEKISLDVMMENLLSNTMATVRTDTNEVLGTVGNNYGIVQNRTAFEFLDTLASGEVGGNRSMIETCGYFRNGGKVFVTCRMDEDFYLPNSPQDKINDYLIFSNTHDGSGGVSVLFSPVRVICQNTLNMALKHFSAKLSFRHSSRVNERLDLTNEENVKRAVQVLEMHKRFKEEFITKLYSLSTERIDRNAPIKFAVELFCDKKQVELAQKANWNFDEVSEIASRTRGSINALLASIESGVGQDAYRGTKLWLYNGLTTFYANDFKYSNSEIEFESRFNANGSTAKRIEQGYKLLASA
jgi:hypothetical protein